MAVPDLPIDERWWIPAGELGWRFSRASGPGGQGVNTTDSRVELVFDLSATAALPEHLRQRALARLAERLVDGVLVVVVAAEHRSQWLNRQAAQQRLAQLLRAAIKPPPPPRRATKPTRGSVERRLTAKRRRGGIKEQRRQRPEEG
jgi:ribosome-associated protein